MLTKTELLERVANDARKKDDPAEKAQGLYDVYLRTPGDRESLAREIAALDPPEHIAKKIGRDLAYIELGKIEGLTGKKREAQIQKTIDVVEALPEAQRNMLLLEIAEKME